MRPLTSPRACGRSLRYCPRKGTMRGSCGAPAATASRLACPPAQKTAWRAAVSAPSRRDRPVVARNAGHRAPEAPARRPRRARRRPWRAPPRRSRRSRCWASAAPAMPAQCGSSSVISSARRRRRPGTALARPRRSSSSRRGELAVVQRDDDLPAALVGDPALVAVVVQARGALDAQPRLQRARLVVDAGVDDAGVVAGLAGADLVGARRPRPRAARAGAQQLARAGQADDARPDDGDVVALPRAG